MADGVYFLTKAELVKVEQKKGLRPRLKKLLTYMYRKDLPNWFCKLSKAAGGKEIPDSHVKSFIGE